MNEKDDRTFKIEKLAIPYDVGKDILNKKRILSDDEKKKKQIVKKLLKKGSIDDIDLSGYVIDYYLDSDKRRINSKSYHKSRLHEQKQGHWDLADKKNINKGVIIPLDKPVYSRNPYRDVQKDSVVAIDFGTKSTVVVVLPQEGKAELLPVGGTFNSLKEKAYENPTIMRMIDFHSFFKQYNARTGRPETQWTDLTISHSAQEEFKNFNEKNYFAFITSLKQWAATENEKIIFKPDNGEDVDILPYLQIKSKDPIEAYAYYIGLTINSMGNDNSIFTNYLLSFPVTYNKAVRDKLCESFKKGLIKSLPNVLAQDKHFIKDNFKISAQTSEPAAYAVCALLAYGIKPQHKDDIHFYGVFDFGGGTTDFDFGLWRGASGTGNEENKKYVIKHFGAGGNRYLGGENLLEFLSYKIFSDEENRKKLLNKEIKFTFPRAREEDYDKFPDYQLFIDKNSLYANSNMQRMKEALRPFWEKHENYQDKYPEKIIEITLFNNDGYQANIQLRVDLAELEELIENKIRKGINSFLDKMLFVMPKYNKNFKKTMNIFLAGNSCKAEIVKTVFKEQCNRIEDVIRKKHEDKGVKFEGKSFNIYPPLGTEESDKIIEEEKKLTIDKNELYRRNGKTGVAFGLIETRPGSQIVVESGEIIFSYLVGKRNDDKFEPVISSATDKGKWIKFISANDRTVEIYYTTDPLGFFGRLDISKAKRKIIDLSEEKPGAYVYVRWTGPAEIEYKVSIEEDDEKPKNDENSKELWEIKKINLA